MAPVGLSPSYDSFHHLAAAVLIYERTVEVVVLRLERLLRLFEPVDVEPGLHQHIWSLGHGLV